MIVCESDQGATMRHRATLAIGFLLLAVPPALGQTAADGSERITAGIVAHELEAMNLSAKTDQDESSDPRVTTKVDGYNWSIYFYDCGTGPLEERGCTSYQFYSGYQVSTNFPLATINKWNTEKRYAKAYTSLQRDKTTNARIEIDVLLAGTGADPGRSFRANFAKMRNAAENFRQAIGFGK